MANKKRTLKRRKIRGGFFWGSKPVDKKNDTGTGNDASNTTKKDPTTDSPEGINVNDIKLEEKVPPKKTWYETFFGSKPQPPPTGNASKQGGGKRKTNKRKSKRKTSQQKR